jgi:hypothetical protein
MLKSCCRSLGLQNANKEHDTRNSIVGRGKIHTKNRDYNKSMMLGNKEQFHIATNILYYEITNSKQKVKQLIGKLLRLLS